jgi:hypothetical protein
MTAHEDQMVIGLSQGRRTPEHRTQ